jgi:hypothetical protein
MTRPETHQNLIHPDKEQNRRLMTINVNEHVLSREQLRHDPVTFPRAKPVPFVGCPGSDDRSS